MQVRILSCPLTKGETMVEEGYIIVSKFGWIKRQSGQPVGSAVIFLTREAAEQSFNAEHPWQKENCEIKTVNLKGLGVQQR